VTSWFPHNSAAERRSCSAAFVFIAARRGPHRNLGDIAIFARLGAAALGLVVADWRGSVTFSPRLGVRDAGLAPAGNASPVRAESRRLLDLRFERPGFVSEFETKRVQK